MSNIDTSKSTICLNMIVKNEAHIINRCLKSVIPYINTWVIADTGSMDGTQKIILETMKDVPGELLEHEWIDFGSNRDQVLQHSAGKADYILTIDADEWLECEEGFDFKNLKSDSYYIMKSQTDKCYWVRNIIKNDIGWQWKGVIHEYLECQNEKTYGEIEGSTIQARQEGARAHDPNTYRKDAALLTKALVDEPDNTRYQFYLAQSWRDADEYDLAILHYERRIKMGGWEEEVFCSKYQIARMMEKLGRPWDECQTAYLDAWSHTPERAEPLYQIGTYHMSQENWPLAWLFLNQAAELPLPQNLILFIEDQVYDYMALFDATVAAGNLGYWEEMETLHKKLMQNKTLSQDMRSLAIDNHEYFMSAKSSNESVAA